MVHQVLKSNLRWVALCIIALAVVLPINNHALITKANSHLARVSSNRSAGLVTGASKTSSSVVYEAEGTAGCRNSNTEESIAIAGRNTTDQLQVITPPSLHSDGGLQIILRATPALDA